MAKTITAAVLVTSVSRAAGAAATRGRLDVSAADGGMIRWAITNSGALGAQCEARIMVARKQGAMPAAAAESLATSGDDAWKRVYVQGGGITSGAITRGSYRFGPEVAYIQIEFEGNTTNACVVECTGDSYAY
jgi:hypothetical protein